MVIPELQRRGLFRTEYESTTFRGNLGVPIPQNRFSKNRVSVQVPARRRPMISRPMHCTVSSRAQRGIHGLQHRSLAALGMTTLLWATTRAASNDQ